MFYALDEYPCLGSKGLSPYPDEWDDQQDMSPTRVRFTPATGALSGVDTWFEYYRGLNDLISAGGRAQIGVRTAAVATFNGYNFDPQRAANPVIAYDAVASLPVLGGLYNDFRAVVYNSKIRLFIAIYGNPSGSNRCAIFESADGFTFTYVGEAQKDATYLGRTIGALANVSGTLVSLVSIADGAGGGNGRQKWISTDGGLTWLDRGLAIHVGDEGDWNGLNYVGGTMQLEGDYYVALLPGMPFIGNDGGGDPYLDWPEAVGAFRIPAASILTADVLWEANSSNPLIIAGPTHNALWHMALFEDRGTIYSTVETWGVPGFENIGTATTRALRTTPYYGTESRVSSSQLYELKMASRHWLDSWTAPVVADGSYTLRHVQSGKFVSVVDGQPVLTEAGTIAEFAIERELSFYTISNADLCLSAIDDLMQTGFEFVENPGALDNVSGQWWIMPWEYRPADQPQLVVLTNRYSRLAASLPRDTETEGAPLVQAPFLGHASMVFELAAVVRAETTTEFPDPENPLLSKDLPSGDLVGTTEPQNLANKTLALAGHTGSIAQLITAAAAGDFDDLADSSVVWAGGCPFAKRAGAAYTGLPVGFVPSGVPTPMHFGAVGDGVTDDYAALAALAAWLAAGDWSEIMVSGRGLSFATSQTLTMSQINSVQFVNGQIIAIGSAGSWANTHSDVTAYFSGIQTVTADSKTWVERNPVVVFDRCVMEWGWDISGGGVAAGARVKNASGNSGAVILRDIRLVDFKTYGTLSLYGHGKLNLDGVTVRQVASGAEYLADRTGYGIAYDNIDTDIVGCTSQWSHCPLLTTGGTLFISNCDIFNGAGNNRYDEIAGTAPTYADLPPSVLFPDSPQNREIWYVTADDLYYQYSVDDGWVVTAVNLPTVDVRLWEHRGNSTINWNGGRIGNGQIHNWAAGGGLTINGAKVGYTGTNASSVWMKCYAVQANQKLGKLSIRDVQWPWELLNGDVPLFSLELDADYPAGSWSTEIDQAFLEALYGNVEVYSNNSKVVSLNGNDPIVTFVGVGAGAKAVFTDKATTVKVSVGVTGNDLELLGARTVAMTSGFGAFEATLSELGAFRPKMATTMTLGTPAAPWANVYANSVKTIGTTVAALPSPATAGAGARGFVTDATAPTFGAIVVGGGTVKTPVYSDGIEWRVG